jgi:hypothetical protein
MIIYIWFLQIHHRYLDRFQLARVQQETQLMNRHRFLSPPMGPRLQVDYRLFSLASR